MEKITHWIKKNKISEIEAVIADFTGIARGKIMPSKKFLADAGLRLPESILIQGVTGDYVNDNVYDDIVDNAEIDMILKPDHNATYIVPWTTEKTAIVIHDCYTKNDKPMEIAPRNILKKVLDLYAKKKWQPIVAPELEFYLTKPSSNPDYPLQPPEGRTGRSEPGRQSYSIDAVNEYHSLFEDVYDWCELQELDVDTLIHEDGKAQMEINFRHGDPLNLADQVFIFKRTVREAALKHGINATFMAKPISHEPGSSMHFHQSILDKNGRNLFSTTPLLGNNLEYFIGGLQKYMLDCMPLLAPNVNSYRRFLIHTAAPVNLAWGLDNRTAGFRIPDSDEQNRRIENRIAGADVNPYLAFSASLLCGFMGIKEKQKPSPKMNMCTYEINSHQPLPSNLEEALEKMEKSSMLKIALGEKFVKAFVEVKRAEYQNFKHIVSSWERQYLQMTV